MSCLTEPCRSPLTDAVSGSADRTELGQDSSSRSRLSGTDSGHRSAPVDSGFDGGPALGLYVSNGPRSAYLLALDRNMTSAPTGRPTFGRRRRVWPARRRLSGRWSSSRRRGRPRLTDGTVSLTATALVALYDRSAPRYSCTPGPNLTKWRNCRVHFSFHALFDAIETT